MLWGRLTLTCLLGNQELSRRSSSEVLAKLSWHGADQLCHAGDSNRSTKSRVQAGRKPPADEETPQKVKVLRALSRASVARG